MTRACLFALASLPLVACNPSEPCDDEGAICTWSGVPGEAMFSAEGQHRLDSQLYLPQGVAFGSDGRAYLPDFNNHRIRQIDADGMVDTVSGTGMLGDGPIGGTGCFGPTYCPADLSAWNHPTDLVVDPNDPNRVVVAAWHNSRINIVHRDSGEMEWFAGTGGRQFGGEGGPKEAAVLDLPSSVAFDERTGLLYFSDQANHLIRRVEADGTITTVAGVPRSAGFSGDGGSALEAQLHGHVDQRADPGSKMDIADGVIYLADTVNGVVRAIDIDAGTIETVAGRYTSAGTNEVPGPDGTTITVDRGSVPGYSGDGGPALDAEFDTPRDVAVYDGMMYVADTKNSCVRVVDLGTGTVDTFAGACGTPGFEGDEGPAADALLDEPFGVSVDAEGNVYIADTLNHVIRRVAAAR